MWSLWSLLLWEGKRRGKVEPRPLPSCPLPDVWEGPPIPGENPGAEAG